MTIHDLNLVPFERVILISSHGWVGTEDLGLLVKGTVFHKTVGACHVNCNFELGYMCRITVIFGTLKDGSLLINILASALG